MVKIYRKKCNNCNVYYLMKGSAFAFTCKKCSTDTSFATVFDKGGYEICTIDARKKLENESRPFEWLNLYMVDFCTKCMSNVVHLSTKDTCENGHKLVKKNMFLSTSKSDAEAKCRTLNRQQSLNSTETAVEGRTNEQGFMIDSRMFNASTDGFMNAHVALYREWRVDKIFKTKGNWDFQDAYEKYLTTTCPRLAEKKKAIFEYISKYQDRDERFFAYFHKYGLAPENEFCWQINSENILFNSPAELIVNYAGSTNKYKLTDEEKKVLVNKCVLVHYLLKDCYDENGDQKKNLNIKLQLTKLILNGTANHVLAYDGEIFGTAENFKKTLSNYDDDDKINAKHAFLQMLTKTAGLPDMPGFDIANDVQKYITTINYYFFDTTKDKAYTCISKTDLLDADYNLLGNNILYNICKYMDLCASAIDLTDSLSFFNISLSSNFEIAKVSVEDLIKNAYCKRTEENMRKLAYLKLLFKTGLIKTLNWMMYKDQLFTGIDKIFSEESDYTESLTACYLACLKGVTTGKKQYKNFYYNEKCDSIPNIISNIVSSEEKLPKNSLLTFWREMESIFKEITTDDKQPSQFDDYIAAAKSLIRDTKAVIESTES